MARRPLWWPSPWPGTYSLAACPSDDDHNLDHQAHHEHHVDYPHPHHSSPGHQLPLQVSIKTIPIYCCPIFLDFFERSISTLYFKLTWLFFLSKPLCECQVFSQLNQPDPKFSSFMGINQSLPTTSYMKWIDLWMMFSIIMPFLEVLAQAGYYMLKGEWLKTQPSALPTISPFPDSRSKVEPMDKPELASSIWSLKTEECILCIKYHCWF